MKYIYVVLFFNFLFLHSQCSETKTIEFTDGTKGFYTGCLDDNELFEGEGVLNSDQSIKKGIWKSGKLNGKGKLTILRNNSVIEGVWKEGNLIKGTYKLKNENNDIKYEGDFEDLKFQGFGVLQTTNSDYSTKKEGEFFNNDLFEGKSLVIWNDGLIVNSTINRGKVIDEKRNDINYYNTNDVIGDQEFSIISLKKEGSENEGVSYIVEMEINGVKGEWIFDTGAELFSIGQRMFKRLVNQGVKYQDLNRTIKTFGVGGESSGRLIILDNIKIGDYNLNNVIVKIANDNNLSLMGMAFLNKFKDVEWSMKKNQLKLFK